jgi:DNA polymerase III delta prime subunit
VEKGIEVAQAWAERELGMNIKSNPDVVVMRYGLLSVEDARRVTELAAGKAFTGNKKVVIIAARRAYHEAQNALLKLFEEPPPGTYLFLVLPSLGGLLPTLRSRVQILSMSDLRGSTSDVEPRRSYIPKAAEEFMKASKEKRSALIKKLTSGKDEEERRAYREEAIAIVNGVEATAYRDRGFTKLPIAMLLQDIQMLRGHLYDRSAPVRMILEHLSLVLPKDLV